MQSQSERRPPTAHVHSAGQGYAADQASKFGAWKRRGAAALILALGLALTSCGRSDEKPFSPETPPRPTTDAGAALMHAHFHFPARPQPPAPGMM